MKVGSNGEMYRPNKVLLSFLKSKEMLMYRDAWGIDTMQKLYIFVDSRMRTSFNRYSGDGIGDIRIFDDYYRSPDYKSDEMGGICEDGDLRSYRYVRLDSGRVYKMKFGRMLRHVIDNTVFGKILPEPVKLWYIEEKCREWETYVCQQYSDYEFHYGEKRADKEYIYDSSHMEGNFHSCMSGYGGDHGVFYTYCKSAAAWLTNTDGKIIARCIVFTECEDCNTGEIVRLAERQYSSGGDERLKRILVEELIKRDLIDGYKRVGADCHSSHNFVSVDGKDWSDRDFKIELNLDYGGVNAYMDSFKYYSIDEYTAYNDDSYGYTDELTSTDDTFGGCYDDFYEEWVDCNEDDMYTVYYRGDIYRIASFRINNGDWKFCADSEYHYIDECCQCSHCGEWICNDDAYYSELTGDDYCCADCMEKAERDYKEDYWYYAEWDNDYFEDKDDVTTIYNKFGHEITISKDSLNELINNREVVPVEDDEDGIEWKLI